MTNNPHARADALVSRGRAGRPDPEPSARALDDDIALDALAMMDEAEYRLMRELFEACLQNIYFGHEHTAYACAFGGWHLILRAIEHETRRRETRC